MKLITSFRGDSFDYYAKERFKTEEERAAHLKRFLIYSSLFLLLLKEQGKEIELVTDKSGKKILVDDGGLEFSSVEVVEVVQGVQHWGFLKILTIADPKHLGKLHLDLDFFVLKKILEQMEVQDFIVDSQESRGGAYNEFFKEAYKKGVHPFISQEVGEVNDYKIYNIGALRINDARIVKEYFEASKKVLETIEKVYPEGMPALAAIFYEQVVVAQLFRKHKIEPFIVRNNFKTFHPWNAPTINFEGLEYAHCVSQKNTEEGFAAIKRKHDEMMGVEVEALPESSLVVSEIVPDAENNKLKVFYQDGTFKEVNVNDLVTDINVKGATLNATTNVLTLAKNGKGAAVKINLGVFVNHEELTESLEEFLESLTRVHVGLGNVDNTPDLGKPISRATQSALDLKADKSDGGASSELFKAGKSFFASSVKVVLSDIVSVNLIKASFKFPYEGGVISALATTNSSYTSDYGVHNAFNGGDHATAGKSQETLTIDFDKPFVFSKLRGKGRGAYGEFFKNQELKLYDASGVEIKILSSSVKNENDFFELQDNSLSLIKKLELKGSKKRGANPGFNFIEIFSAHEEAESDNVYVEINGVKHFLRKI